MAPEFIRNMEAQIAQLQAEVARLEAALAESKEIEAAAGEVVAVNATLEHRIAMLEAENKLLQAQATAEREQAETARKEKETAQRELDNAVNEKCELGRAVEGLTWKNTRLTANLLASGNEAQLLRQQLLAIPQTVTEHLQTLTQKLAKGLAASLQDHAAGAVLVAGATGEELRTGQEPVHTKQGRLLNPPIASNEQRFEQHLQELKGVPAFGSSEEQEELDRQKAAKKKQGDSKRPAPEGGCDPNDKGKARRRDPEEDDGDRTTLLEKLRAAVQRNSAQPSGTAVSPQQEQQQAPQPTEGPSAPPANADTSAATGIGKKPRAPSKTKPVFRFKLRGAGKGRGKHSTGRGGRGGRGRGRGRGAHSMRIVGGGGVEAAAAAADDVGTAGGGTACAGQQVPPAGDSTAQGSVPAPDRDSDTESGELPPPTGSNAAQEPPANTAACLWCGRSPSRKKRFAVLCAHHRVCEQHWTKYGLFQRMVQGCLEVARADAIEPSQVNPRDLTSADLHLERAVEPFGSKRYPCAFCQKQSRSIKGKAIQFLRYHADGGGGALDVETAYHRAQAGFGGTST